MTTKFTQFPSGGLPIAGDQIVGLRSGQNYRFTATANPVGANSNTTGTTAQNIAVWSGTALQLIDSGFSMPIADGAAGYGLLTNGLKQLYFGVVGGVTSITAGTGLTASPNPIIGTGTISLTAPVPLNLGGTNNATLTAVNGGVVYSDSTKLNVLATANNGILATDGSGIPSITSTLPNAVQNNITRLGTIASIGAPLGGTYGGTGVNNGASTFTMGGSVTFSGAYTFTGTLTGNTNVTFPTSGTLTNTSNTVGRNRIINGDFTIWQRGAGGSASFAISGAATQFTADRWQSQAGAATNITVTQLAGATTGSYYAQVQRNNLNAGTAVIYHATTLPIDCCVGMAGNFLTLGFSAYCGANFSAASSNLTVKVITGTGATDVSNLTTGFTGASTVINQSATLTTSPTFFSYTTASAVGSTVTQAYIEFSYTPTGTAGANDWFAVTNVQLEKNNVATAFDRRGFWENWRMCQPYYQKTFFYATAPVQNAGAFTGEYMFLDPTALGTTSTASNYQYYTPMRANPTITGYNPAAANAQIRNVTRSQDCSLLSFATITLNNVHFTYKTSSTSGTFDDLHLHMTLDAEFT